jgi:hypothetical protein
VRLVQVTAEADLAAAVLVGVVGSFVSNWHPSTGSEKEGSLGRSQDYSTSPSARVSLSSSAIRQKILPFLLLLPNTDRLEFPLQISGSSSSPSPWKPWTHLISSQLCRHSLLSPKTSTTQRRPDDQTLPTVPQPRHVVDHQYGCNLFEALTCTLPPGDNAHLEGLSAALHNIVADINGESSLPSATLHEHHWDPGAFRLPLGFGVNDSRLGQDATARSCKSLFCRSLGSGLLREP